MSRYFSSKIFREISVIKNRKNLHYFLFFFVFAILGYASIMRGNYLYNDDYPRYILNFSCGGLSANCLGRHMDIILEYVMYLSHIVMDATPFTQVVSCVLLAYTALVCTKIFCKNDSDYKPLIFCIVAVNPYIIENMSFHFDNIFMMIALLSSVLSAYISTTCDKKHVLLQTILLLLCLLTYQAALSAYFIVFLYLLAEKITNGEQVTESIKKMRYWIYTMFFAAVFYSPIAYRINYASSNEKLFSPELSTKYLILISSKIFYYFENMYSDWKFTYVGWITSVFLVFFIAAIFSYAWKNKKNICDYVLRCAMLVVLLFLLLLAPLGVTIFLSHAGSASINIVPPRIIFTIGIIFSIIIYKSMFLLEKTYLLRAFYKIFAIILVIWNVTFANSFGNLAEQEYSLKNDISYSIAEDIYELRKNHNISNIYPEISRILSPSSRRAVAEFPIISRLLKPLWSRPLFSNILLKYNGYYFPRVYYKYSKQLSLKSKIVDKMWYELYMPKDDTLIIKIKGPQN